MQIKLKNVSYKNLKDLTFDIEQNKITGIVSKNINDLIKINRCIKNNNIESGAIKYSKKISKVGLITISDTCEMIYGTVSDFINKENIRDELFELLEINKNILNKNLNILSTSEKIKILFLKCLNENYDTILIDGILEVLDIKLRKKIINIIINLKKFENKTIVISSVDIDLIYEFIDNLILIVNGNSYFSVDKYCIFDEVNNNLVNKPFVKTIEDLIYQNKNINLGNNESINELIKAIYREVR